MTTVTPTDLRKKLRIATNKNYTGNSGLTRIQTNNDTTEDTEKKQTSNSSSITIKKFNKIHHNEIILDDKTRAEILQPVPCLKWKCLATPDSKGTMTLNKKLEATILRIGKEQYCLGIRGNTDELEIIIDMGTTEIRANDNYLNIKTKHLVVNGKEVKKS